MDFSDYTKKEVLQHFRDQYYENKICAEVGQELERNYPGWRWWVECTLPSGMFSVKNLDLDGEYGFVSNIASYLTNPERHKMIMRAGGEVLERYNQNRGAKPGKIDIVRNIRGNAIGDIN